MTFNVSSLPAATDTRSRQVGDMTLRLEVPPMFGRYAVVGKLGGGGMGAVYLARQKGPGGFSRDVALKVMLPDLAQSLPSAPRMFLEEMRVLASINHNNVVRILDFGDEQGTLYMAMEYLPGITLLSLASQLYVAKRAFPQDLAASLLAQACRGLHAAHELRDDLGEPRGLVHRDVTPQNIMFSSEGGVKLIDFGIIWAKDRLVEATSTPQIKGKLAYMSPEQVAAAPLTRSSDLFSIGVILYELLSGRPLFQRESNIATMRAVIEAQVPSLRALRNDVPPRLDDLVLRTLSRDPTLRPESAAALADGLDEIVWEAGGRFARPEVIARHLQAIGVNLMGQPPARLTEAPWFAQIPRSAATERDDGVLTIAPPPPGVCTEQRLPDGRRLVLQSLVLDEHWHQPVPFVFTPAPELLPAPLLLSPRATSLFVELDRNALLPGGRRPSIYHDAAKPSTRCEGFHIPEIARDVSFDVGHRHARVQRIRCDSGAARDGSKHIRVDLGPLGVAIVTSEAARLAILSTVDPTSGATYLACVSIC